MNKENIKMRYGSFTCAALLAFMMVNLSASPVFPQTRLGLHVTQEELNIWKQRATSGPYKTTGDVSTNSPGDWDRISANAEAFRGSPTGTYWTGPAGSGCVNTTFMDPGTTRAKTILMRDAAFKALVNNDTDLKTKAKTWLYAQATEANLDFDNRTRWCAQAGINPEYTWGVSQWMIPMIYAMDYLEILDPNVFTSGERAALKIWFEGFADFTYKLQDISVNGLFVDRPNGNYTPKFASDCAFQGNPYYGEPCISQYGAYYNNRRGENMAILGSVGVKFGNQTFIDKAKLHVKEVLRFGVFPNEYLADFYRGTTDVGGGAQADFGWQYSHAIAGNAIRTADETARIGDSELYNYITSLGVYGSGGGSKNLLFVMRIMAKYVDHTFDRYGTKVAGNVGNQAYRIDGRSTNGCQNPGEVSMVLGNLYYKDAYFKSVYMRQAAGTPSYPSCIIFNGPFNPWLGTAFSYPGVLFMFGQMEGNVWPYPSGGSQLPTINFAANPATIADGQSSTLTWSTNNTTSCSASDGWTGSKATSGTQNVTPSQTTTYSLNCTGAGGSATQSTTINMSLPLLLSPTGLIVTSGQQ